MTSQHCTSLELSKRLKEVGYPQDDSMFYWQDCRQWRDKKGGGLEEVEPVARLREWGELKEGDFYSAPLASELGEVMKDVDIAMPKYWAGNWEFEDTSTEKFILSDTESDARAKMLLYLAEQGIINFEKK